MAARCFEDVIERYKQHAFAHYFLAKAYTMMGGHEARVQANMDAYRAIVANSDTWKEHAAYFGLDDMPHVMAPPSVPLRLTEPAQASA